jgi:hypothetical protein
MRMYHAFVDAFCGYCRMHAIVSRCIEECVYLCVCVCVCVCVSAREILFACIMHSSMRFVSITVCMVLRAGVS